MNKSFLILFFLYLNSVPCWSENISSILDLRFENGIYYHKNSSTPYSGKFSNSREKGNYLNGKKSGLWLTFRDNGQISEKYFYKEGKADGPYEDYYPDGQLGSKGIKREGRKEGYWVFYRMTGDIDKQLSGFYSNGDKINVRPPTNEIIKSETVNTLKEYFYCFSRKNHACLLFLTHPKYIFNHGGPEKILAELNELDKQFEKDGHESFLSDAEISEPEIIIDNNFILAIIRYNFSAKIFGDLGKMYTSSLVFSDNGGRTYYVGDVEEISKLGLFTPELTAKINQPQTRFIPDG